MELDSSMLPWITFACQDYIDREGKYKCRNSTRLPDVPMVDALFCLMFAPVVQVIADGASKRFFTKLVCDNGELEIPLTHVLTHRDLEIAQNVRDLLNSSLCDRKTRAWDQSSEVNKLVERLLFTERTPLETFMQWSALRQEDYEMSISQMKTPPEIFNRKLKR